MRGCRSLPSVLLLAVPVTDATVHAQTWVDRTEHPRFNASYHVRGGPDDGPVLERLGGLHAWTGSGWRRFAPVPNGGASIVELAFDRQRGRTVALVLDPFAQDLRTSELVGGNWLAAGPTLPAGTDIHYDPALGRVVAFGHPSATTTQDHSWDGVGWIPMTPNLRPPHVRGLVAADLQRSRLVVHTTGLQGLAPQTWEWDGAQWSQRPSAISPPPRAHGAMAYDEAAGRVVLHGGITAAQVPLADTWAWDGVGWTDLNPATVPPATGRPLLGYDRNEARLLLIDASGTAADDHVWVGNDWRPVATGRPRAYAWQSATDPVRGVLVQYAADATWTWDGVTWTRAVTPGPSSRIAPAASDPSTGDVVVFGGGAFGNPFLTFGDTWTWNGSAWSQRNPVPAPPPRRQHALVTRGASSGVVLFGGTSPGYLPLADTWLYSGGTWVDLTPSLPTSPPGGPTYGASGAPGSDPVVLAGDEVWRFDGAWNLVSSTLPPVGFPNIGLRPDGRPVLAGSTGSGNASYEFVNGVWLPQGELPIGFDSTAHDPLRGNLIGFDRGEPYVYTAAPASAVEVGAGCGNPAPRLYEDGFPRIGNPGLLLRAADTQVVTLFALDFASQPLALGSGCTSYLAAPTVVGIIVPNVHGVAALPLPVPANNAFRGLAVWAQVATLQPGGPLGGIAVSAALRLTLGD